MIFGFLGTEQAGEEVQDRLLGLGLISYDAYCLSKEKLRLEGRFYWFAGSKVDVE